MIGVADTGAAPTRIAKPSSKPISVAFLMVSLMPLSVPVTADPSVQLARRRSSQSAKYTTTLASGGTYTPTAFELRNLYAQRCHALDGQPNIHVRYCLTTC